MANAERFIIVVGTDFSEHAEHALDRALEKAAARPGSEVHVVHVAPEHRFGVTAKAGVLGPEATVDAVDRFVLERMERVRARVDTTPIARVVAHYRHGSPAEGIARLAGDVGADLVVIGSRAADIANPVLGPNGERISRLVRCPILVVAAPPGEDVHSTPSSRAPPSDRLAHPYKRAWASNGVYAAQATVVEGPASSTRS